MAIKAYAIHRIQRGAGEIDSVPAGKVFDLDKQEFDALEKLGAVRRAGADEIALAKEAEKRANGEYVDASEEGGENGGPAIQPPSGADGDPAGAPKGAKPKGPKATKKADTSNTSTEGEGSGSSEGGAGSDTDI